MRVIVIKQYKHYVPSTELDITNELYELHTDHFKPIVRVIANTGLQKPPTGKKKLIKKN